MQHESERTQFTRSTLLVSNADTIFFFVLNIMPWVNCSHYEETQTECYRELINFFSEVTLTK